MLAFIRSAVALLGVVLGLPAVAAQPVYHEFMEGNPNAKVTVVEYASLTCPHCAHFYMDSFPQLKKSYIDSGKIKFIFRDLPTPPQQLAIAAAALARCAPNDRGMELVGLLYKNQQEWEQTPEPSLRKYTAQVGMSKDDFDDCLKNRSILDEMQRVAETASTLYKVEGTPTFLVNGDMVQTTEFPELAQAIDAALTAAKKK